MLRPKDMMNHLREADIGTCIHHPIPLHLRKAFASPDYRLGDFPVTEKAATKILSLPISAQLSAEQQARVVEKILNFADIASVSEQARTNSFPWRSMNETA